MITDRLIVIAENLKTKNNNIISRLLVSPEGELIAEVQNGFDDFDFASDWSVEYLNELCEKYTFANSMQASLIIDLLVSQGYLTYSDRCEFEERLADGISSVKVREISSLTDDAPSSVSRREFIERFCDAGGYSPDEIFEFICDIEGINGITVQNDAYNLYFMFSPETGFCYPLFTMSTEQNRTDFYMKPAVLKTILSMHGCNGADTDAYIAYFEGFLDRNMCNNIPYENINDGYFADLSALIDNADEFVFKTSKYINNLYKGA